MQIALSYEGQTEKGANRSPFIDSLNTYAGSPKGSPYCAAFVSYTLYKAGAKPAIRTGLATALITKKSISAKKVLMGTATIPAGSIIIWRKGETIYGHAGFTTELWKGSSGKTIEANTSPGKAGSQRDGDGIYQRSRTIYPLEYFRITHFTPVSYE